MKRLYLLLAFLIALLLGCSSRNPLDITPEQFISSFNEKAEPYGYKATQIESEKFAQYQINDQCGFTINTNDSGSIDLISVATEMSIGVDNASLFLTNAMTIRAITYSVFNEKSNVNELVDKLSVFDPSDNISLTIGGITYTRMPNVDNVQILVLSRPN